MKRIIPFYYFFVIIFGLILNSCATTSLTSISIDNRYQGGTLKNILVIGVIEPQTLRNYFEDELVRQLQTKGTKAVSSYAVFPDHTMPEQAAIDLKIKELGSDSVLVARLVDVLDVDSYVTYPTHAANSGLSGYYVLCCQSIITAGYNVKFETKIFDVKNNQLIWSALSETTLERSPENMATSFIKAIMKDLHDKQLLQ
jgi:hypothetical protein